MGKNISDELFKQRILVKVIGVTPHLEDYERIVELSKQHHLPKGTIIKRIIRDWFTKN